MMGIKSIWHSCFILFSFQAGAQSSALPVADSLYALGNYAAAINAYAKENNTVSSLQIARAYNAIGNYDKAIVQYQETLVIEPNLDIARFELGKLLLKTKKYDLALESINELVSREQENPEYYYYLGRVWESLKNQKKADEAFRKAVQKDSTHLRSLYSLARSFASKNEKDSVLKYVDMGLRFYEDDVSMINLKALAFFNNGQFGLAIPHFERLLELGEEAPFVYNRLAHSYFRDLELEKAHKTYHQLMKFPEYLADAYSGLGEVFLKEQQLDSAQYYIQKSIKERTVAFDKEYADLGRIARIQGKTKTALDLYAKAWEENKDNPYNYYQVCILADEYYRDPKTKLGYYERLLEMYPDLAPFIAERVQKRISEIREEIHYAGN
ncbi:tetratricopeptide repeat protein [Allomuricauda taeanensis]|uniref:tetratricopeptide repeat protein n=1 Tax=Flagellimonas taeanensis TaxID=1005926 RepID=UPI002E7ACC94|nr:tetratricopeptide repeat protein [Allomuricauda taeanensis]MEE1962080.1 tetratricopeptide repeat protein [Allomuricauda taeanensis]